MKEKILYVENNPPIKNPGFDDIQSALSKLNGKDITLMELTIMNSGTLMAIGGNEQLVVVTYVPENPEEDSPSVCDLSQPLMEEKWLTFEGEITPYPAQFAINLDLATKAFETFLHKGTLNNKIEWKNI